MTTISPPSPARVALTAFRRVRLNVSSSASSSASSLTGTRISADLDSAEMLSVPLVAA